MITIVERTLLLIHKQGKPCLLLVEIGEELVSNITKTSEEGKDHYGFVGSRIEEERGLSKLERVAVKQLVKDLVAKVDANETFQHRSEVQDPRLKVRHGVVCLHTIQCPHLLDFQLSVASDDVFQFLWSCVIDRQVETVYILLLYSSLQLSVLDL